MGCFQSKEGTEEESCYIDKEAPTKKYDKPKWNSSKPMTASQLTVRTLRKHNSCTPQPRCSI